MQETGSEYYAKEHVSKFSGILVVAMLGEAPLGSFPRRIEATSLREQVQPRALSKEEVFGEKDIESHPVDYVFDLKGKIHLPRTMDTVKTSYEILKQT